MFVIDSLPIVGHAGINDQLKKLAVNIVLFFFFSPGVRGFISILPFFFLIVEL